MTDTQKSKIDLSRYIYTFLLIDLLVLLELKRLLDALESKQLIEQCL